MSAHCLGLLSVRVGSMMATCGAKIVASHSTNERDVTLNPGSFAPVPAPTNTVSYKGSLNEEITRLWGLLNGDHLRFFPQVWTNEGTPRHYGDACMDIMVMLAWTWAGCQQVWKAAPRWHRGPWLVHLKSQWGKTSSERDSCLNGRHNCPRLLPPWCETSSDADSCLKGTTAPTRLEGILMVPPWGKDDPD